MKGLLVLLAFLMLAGSAATQEPARLQPGASALITTGSGWAIRGWDPRRWSGPPPLELRLVLDQAVPYRAFLVADPVRLIVDLKGADLTGAVPQDALYGADLVPAIRWDRFRDDWSRIVIELPGAYRIASAGQNTGLSAPQITIALEPVDDTAFAPRPSATTALRDLPPPAQLPAAPVDDGRLVVMLDPGHGGHDPGAEAGGETEADLVLTFALELRRALQDRGVHVVMTREDDSFVPLERRITLAREAGADLFVSLHADALPTGQAAGATVYIWNPASDEQSSRQLMLRHDRTDLVTGVDLTGQDDALAGVLMDFVRTDTQPRSEGFARVLASRMALMGIGLHGRPVQGAAFSVLKSPDIPSVLLELGFLSDAEDRANLTDPLWRAGMVQVVSDAVTGWARDQAGRAALLRH